MCWQILAVKSLRDETMKVYDALESGDLAASRRAVSMIVGRDTDRLDDAAVTRAAVETAGGDIRKPCADGCGRVSADHHGHLGLRVAHGHRRRAAGLFLQGGEHHGLHAGVCGAAL